MKFNGSSKPKKPNALQTLRVQVPRKTFEKIKEFAQGDLMPISRFLMYAIDNELDADIQFNYPVPVVTEPYVKGAYIAEAQRMLRFIRLFPNGLGRDMLLLCRREFDIEDKNLVMLGLRELLESKSVFEDEPLSRYGQRRGPAGYRHIKARGYRQSTLDRLAFEDPSIFLERRGEQDDTE